MAKPISFGELDFKIVASMDETMGVPEPEDPFHILVLGDFSGRENRHVFETGSTLLECRVVEVDRDNLNDVMARMKPEIRLPFTDTESDALAIHFSEMEDFHPDRLYEQLEIFSSIKELQRKLDDPRTFEEAAAEIRSWSESETSGTQELTGASPAPKPDIGEQEPAGLLDRILEGDGSGPTEIQPTSARADMSRFMKKIVQPYLVPGDDPRQMELEETVYAAAGEMMRIILHHPDFQALESGWRGLDFLASRLETDARLKVYVIDLSKSELAADLKETNELRNSGLYKLLVEQTIGTAGGEPWALIGGNYTFGTTQEDAELLGRLAKITSAGGAPFIAAAHPNLLGCNSLADTPDPDDWRSSKEASAQAAWQELQKLPESANLGLALPRFLLRLPYGVETDPLDQFEFEEMAAEPRHEDYLWGNPCFACICLLGQAFSLEGWNLQPGAGFNIENLPLHIYRSAGETQIKPCAEVLLTERAAEKIMNSGFMPLISFRDQDRVRLARFQSLTLPPTRLAGRWEIK
jgi:type VI secretion system protein ImpC